MKSRQASWFTVAELVCTVWLGELSRQLNGSRKAARTLLVLAVGGLLAWQGIGVASRVTLQNSLTVPEDLQLSLGAELVVASLAVPALLMTILLMLAPEQSILDSFLAPLPVSRRSRRLGGDAPLFVISLVISALVLTPILVTSAPLLEAHLGTRLAFTVYQALVLGSCLAWSIFRASVWAACARDIVPSFVARFAAGLVVIAGAVVLVVSRPAIPWASGSDKSLPTAIACGSLPGTGAVALLVLTTFLGRPTPNGSSGHARVLQRSARRPPSGRSLLQLELLQWYRSPLVLTVDGLVVVTSLTLLLLVPQNAPSWPLLSTGIMVAAGSGTAMLARGLTRQSDWLPRSRTARSRSWVKTKLAASAIAAANPSILCLIFLLVSGRISALAPGPTSALTLLAFGGALLAGTVLPVDEGVGLSSIATAALALSLDASVVAAFSKTSLAIATPAAAALGMLFIGASAALLSRRAAAA